MGIFILKPMPLLWQICDLEPASAIAHCLMCLYALICYICSSTHIYIYTYKHMNTHSKNMIMLRIEGAIVN